ncbi:hypothetical protein VCCP1047_3441, partial [Vibrio cholerae CP1047(20)]
MTRSALLIS